MVLHYRLTCQQIAPVFKAPCDVRVHCPRSVIMIFKLFQLLITHSNDLGRKPICIRIRREQN